MRPGTQSLSVGRRASAADARANIRLFRRTSSSDIPASASRSSSAFASPASRTSVLPRSESDLETYKPLRDSGNVAAAGKIEHGSRHRNRTKAASVRVDRMLHRKWKLELAARRRRDRSARIEDARVEAPHVHAHCPHAGHRARGCLVRLFEDAAEVTIIADVEERELENPLGRNVSIGDERLTVER